MNNSYLQHHGIKGQKWGVRRYQNDDGSLTAAGEKRYYKDALKRAKREYKNATNDAKKHGTKVMGGLLTVASKKQQQRINEARTKLNQAKLDNELAKNKKLTGKAEMMIQKIESAKELNKLNSKTKIKNDKFYDELEEKVEKATSKTMERVRNMSYSEIKKAYMTKQEGKKKITPDIKNTKMSATRKTNSDKKLAKEMLDNYDMNDPDAAEAMELLREIKRGR